MQVYEVSTFQKLIKLLLLIDHLGTLVPLHGIIVLNQQKILLISKV